MQQRGHRDTPVLIALSITVDREIHYSKEGIGVHVLVLTYLLHRFVSKAQVNAKASQTLKDVVIVGDECNHLIVGFVHFLITHDTTFLILIKSMDCFSNPCSMGFYFAYATERVSRMTVILTCPG